MRIIGKTVIRSFSKPKIDAILIGKMDGEPSHTGNTDETLVGSILIPANTIIDSDFIEINHVFSKVGSVNSAILRARVSNSEEVGGDAIVYKSISAYTPNPTGTTNLLKSIPGANTLFYIGDVDWTIDKYINVTIQLNDAADMVKVESFYLKLFR